MSSKAGKGARAPRKSALTVSAPSDPSSLGNGIVAAVGDGDDVGVGGSEEFDPLSKTFDPSRLKVAELRALLFQHDVHISSAARKPALVQAYEQHIRANADELRALRNRDFNVRPDGRGIVYLANGQVQRSPSAAHSDATDASIGGDESDTAHQRARARRSVSWADSGHASDADLDESGSFNVDTSAADVSTFSMENPFQSRTTSPLTHHLQPNAAKGRKPRASEPAKRDGTSSTTKSKTSTSKRLSLPPVRHRANASQQQQNGDDSTDVDTTRSSMVSPLVQKQQRLRQWVDHAKEDAVSLVKTSNDNNEEGGTLAGFFSFVSFLLVAAWWVWFTRDSRQIGFCDVDRPSNANLDQREIQLARAKLEGPKEGVQALLANARLPEILRPSCAPCPAHAQCSMGQLTGCESDDYVLRSPILSYIPLVRSVLPLSNIKPWCEPDEEKLLLAADLADEIENSLRHWKGDVYCNRQRARFGPRDEPEWGSDGLYALPTSDVYHEMKQAASRGSILRTQAEGFFRQLWDLALADLHASGRVQERSSRMLAMRGALGVGVQCRTGLAMSSIWQRLRVWLVVAIALLGSVQWLRMRVRRTSDTRKQAKELVEVALRKLQSAKRRYIQQQQQYGGDQSASPSTPGAEAFFSISQLRDYVLQRELNERRRRELWARVSKMVETNTNVRTRQAKVQGEWTKAWEWVGPVEEEEGGMMMERGNDPFAQRRMRIEQRPIQQEQEFDYPRHADVRVGGGGGGGEGSSSGPRLPWSRQDVRPEKELRKDDYNAAEYRRPSAEV